MLSRRSIFIPCFLLAFFAVLFFLSGHCFAMPESKRSTEQPEALTVSVLEKMVGKKVEIRLMDSAKLKGRLLRVYVDSLEVRPEGEKEGTKVVKMSEIESIKRATRTNPLIYIAIGLFGFIVFGVLVGISVGS